MNIKNIGIIGTGGVGGYFGAKLARILSVHPEAHVYFIARGRHLDEIRKEGLILSTSEDGESTVFPTNVTDRIEDLPSLDLCLVCVKSYDLTGVIRRLQCVTQPDTVMIPLLNGVDIEERIRAAGYPGILFPACVYIGTHIERPGKVVQSGGACRIYFGMDSGHPDMRRPDVFELFDQSGIRYTWLDDPYPDIWQKFMFIAAFGMVGAVTGKTLGQMIEEEGPARDIRSILHEIHVLAKNRNIHLPDQIEEISFSKGRAFPPGTKTSIQRDFECKHRPDERDLFGSTILKLYRLSGMDAPVMRRIVREMETIKPASLFGTELLEAFI